MEFTTQDFLFLFTLLGVITILNIKKRSNNWYRWFLLGTTVSVIVATLIIGIFLL
jgi:hypothetical protein